MGQPVRKQIQAIHSDLIEEPPIYTLLVDGNSLLFMAMRDDKVNAEGIHYGGIYQFLLQMRMMMQKKDFDYIYVTFDNTYSGYLRYELYPQYKANRDKDYASYGLSDYMRECNVRIASMQKYLFSKNKPKNKSEMTASEKTKAFYDENFDRERDVLLACFEELFIRTYMDEVVEGDDIIAYYCMNKKPNEKIIIMSGDMDLSQLLAEDIAIYNLHLKKFITNKNFKENFGYPCENTLVKKIFTGDSSDNISNIAGLSEDGFFKLMPEAKEKPVTVEEVKERARHLINERIESKKKPLKVHENIINGVSNKEYDGDFYEINEKLINLRKPLLTDDAKEIMESMMYAPIDPEGRSFTNLLRIFEANGITEFMGDTKFASFFNLFKRIQEKEIKRYANSKI